MEYFFDFLYLTSYQNVNGEFEFTNEENIINFLFLIMVKFNPKKKKKVFPIILNEKEVEAKLPERVRATWEMKFTGLVMKTSNED